MANGQMPRIVHSHPDLTTIFVQEAGKAFRERGWPATAVTHYVDRPDLLWRRAIAGIGRAAGMDLDREFRRRELIDCPWERIDSSAGWELLRLAALRSGLD